uniref:BPL/LPL catalytic domain-containing protein n=1 Tax=Chromera velia CCMP2878 TaxID=1169474 RepID=A0A0G4I2Q2_9ALVE|eukprot:Cvel_10468.t1-p1 / transcript=Cvel_10468.t1 / gene=Cvel_10468 / organism=Chromera_velia_CCMP2878 / gene_product=hypothetical protein / transcript_product=hypothetical protein / location=Cvel_scaffold631:13113-17977(+) / protein_length=321 / sequence_SO=supercontig / SO=protein_coding / is_pseudo=false
MGGRFNILRLPRVHIFDQLLLEEALYRTSSENWLLQNEGGGKRIPAIVLGISGKPSQWVNVEAAEKNRVPMIRRYTGGGTVYIDHNVVFSSFILDKTLCGVPPFPKEMMKWSGNFYGRVFGTERFRQQADDYAVLPRESLVKRGQGGGEDPSEAEWRKVGGNAQAFAREKVAHHTSFLWKLNDVAMQTYLPPPPREPKYREGRSHRDFLCGLEDMGGEGGDGRAFFGSPDAFLDRVKREATSFAEERGCTVQECEWTEKTRDEMRGVVSDFLSNERTRGLRATWVVDRDGKRLDDSSPEVASLGLAKLAKQNSEISASLFS